MTIAEFLEARLDEDEAWAVNPECDQDPARALRDVEAKRRMAERAALVLNAGPWDRDPEGSGALLAIPGRRQEARRTLESLASIYSDHPDYEEAVRP